MRARIKVLEKKYTVGYYISQLPHLTADFRTDWQPVPITLLREIEVKDWRHFLLLQKSTKQILKDMAVLGLKIVNIIMIIMKMGIKKGIPYSLHFR